VILHGIFEAASIAAHAGCHIVATRCAYMQIRERVADHFGMRIPQKAVVRLMLHICIRKWAVARFGLYSSISGCPLAHFGLCVPKSADVRLMFNVCIRKWAVARFGLCIPQSAVFRFGTSIFQWAVVCLMFGKGMFRWMAIHLSM
jgi:hypothetical protein